MMGNWFSVVALLSWPFVAAILFRVNPTGKAAIWTILGAFLFLPAGVEIKIPMIPALDKNSIPNVSALVGCMLLFVRTKLPSRGSFLAYMLILICVASPIATSAFNSDPIFVGEIVLPGVGMYDAISAGLSQLIFFLPFLVGWRYLRKFEDNEAILRALAIAGLLYSFGILFEVRMSPVLADWIYGYSPSGFFTSLRYGGYRPTLFMENGLVLFVFCNDLTFLATLALGRAKVKMAPLRAPIVSVYLGAILIICKSAGALVYGVFSGFLVTLTNPRTQIKVSVVLVSLTLVYPAVRAADLFPTGALVQVTQMISEDRAESLGFRFNQEEQLLAKAMQRPFLGWGRYGRNRVFNEESGRDTSITDGQWIITLGTFGFVGFFAQFGLLALPVFRARKALKLAGSVNEKVLLAALTLIVALTIIEQLPNASISPWSWLHRWSAFGTKRRSSNR